MSLLFSNRHIDPSLSNKAMALIRALNAPVIAELVDLWLSSQATRPQIADQDQDQDDYDPINDDDADFIRDNGAKNYSRLIQNLRSEVEDISRSKKMLLKKITKELWPEGLNLLQVAQVQCKNILETNKDNHLWSYSTMYCGEEEFVPVIEPTSFLEALQKALYPLMLGHIYVTTHQELSLFIVRVQIFEPKLGASTNRYTPAKPIYLAFPVSSPHILHTFGEDVYITGTLHALRNVLSRPGRPVSFKKTSSLPSKNLFTFATIKGISRHAASLGPWSIYAEGLVDESPLNNFPVKRHSALKHTSDAGEKRVRLANVKYTGRPDGAPSFDERAQGKKYESKLPMSMVEFKIAEPFDARLTSPEFTIRLEGSDVFAGLYDLVLDGPGNIEDVPSWLTGADGMTSGIVRDGKLQPSL